MEAICQRCHESLREPDRFCPACGLPQLIYVPAETPLIPLSTETGADDPAKTGYGTMPAQLAEMSGIAWRPALQAALLLAIPVSVLSFGLLPVGLLWMVGAAAWAVSIYARRTRTTQVPAGTGVRIGLITGLFASWLTFSFYGISLWVSRFVLHQGNQWDTLWQEQVDKAFQQNAAAQMGIANAQSTQYMQSLRALMLSTDGRAGLTLSLVGTIAAFLVLFSIVGGAIGAKLPIRPRGRA